MTREGWGRCPAELSRHCLTGGGGGRIHLMKNPPARRQNATLLFTAPPQNNQENTTSQQQPSACPQCLVRGGPASGTPGRSSADIAPTVPPHLLAGVMIKALWSPYPMLAAVRDSCLRPVSLWSRRVELWGATGQQSDRLSKTCLLIRRHKQVQMTLNGRLILASITLITVYRGLLKV